MLKARRAIMNHKIYLEMKNAQSGGLPVRNYEPPRDHLPDREVDGDRSRIHPLHVILFIFLAILCGLIAAYQAMYESSLHSQ